MTENTFLCLWNRHKHECWVPKFQLFTVKNENIKFLWTYACGVLIQRTLTGKLALWSQKFNWIHPSQEKAQKPLKFNQFGAFFLKWVSPIKFLTLQFLLTIQSPLDRNPICSCFDKKYFSLFYWRYKTWTAILTNKLKFWNFFHKVNIS